MRIKINPLDPIANGALRAETKTDDEVLTKLELATRLKITVRTLDNWTANGVLPFIKIGSRIVRFRWSEVLESLKKLETRRRT